MRRLPHQDILPDSDRRDLADNNYSAREKVIFTDRYKHDTKYNFASHVPDICPTILSPITILIIRRYHSSWASPGGLILMGGYGSSSERTTEKIQEDETSTYSFDLKYSTE